MVIFSLIARVISGHFRGKSDETQLRRELLAHRRRQLIHEHIPDVEAARRTFGEQFDVLVELLIAHDPGQLGKLAPESPYYPELARTLLFQLSPNKPIKSVPALLQQEVSLWFGTKESQADLLRLSDVIEQLVR